MSEEMKQFTDLLKNDKALSEKFDELLSACETSGQVLDAAVAFAAEQGIALNKENIRFIKEDKNSELSDEEVGSVAGGSFFDEGNGRWVETVIETETDIYRYWEWVKY